jgi:hypothetical protein
MLTHRFVCEDALMQTTNTSSMAGQFVHPEFDVVIVLAIRKGSELPVEVRRCICNEERPHPAPEDRLPAEVYLG